jgi:hypothetical protein
MHLPIRLLASRREAAVALAVSVRTIDALAEKGDLRPIWIGSRKLFAWSELKRLAGVDMSTDATSSKTQAIVT